MGTTKSEQLNKNQMIAVYLILPNIGYLTKKLGFAEVCNNNFQLCFV